MYFVDIPDLSKHLEEPPETSDGDEFLDPDVENPEESAAIERTHAHIVHCKTRCWSAVDSSEMMFILREANNKYFEKYTADAGMNLTQEEYISLSHILGILLNIAEVQRYIEGDLYETGSILHPLTMMLRTHFARGKIKCPQLVNPQAKTKKTVKGEDMSPEGKMVLRKVQSELHRIFGDEPSTLQEKKCIYLDPRLKSLDLYTQRTLHGENAVWKEARDAVKADIVSAIKFDRDRELEMMMNEPVGGRAVVGASSPPARAARREGGDDGSDSSDDDDGSFATAMSKLKPPADGVPPVVPALAAPLLPEEMAEIELREYDALPELARVLIPNRAQGEQPINLCHYWTDVKLRRPSRYLPIVALANQSSMASAGSSERYFRAVSFVNDLRRYNQNPSTIKRLAYLQRNPEYMPSAEQIMQFYKYKLISRKQLSDRRASGKRGLTVDSGDEEEEEEEEEDFAPPPAFDDDPDVERPAFTYEEFVAGFDMDELMAWAGLQGELARATGGGGGGAGTGELADGAAAAAAPAAAAAATGAPATAP